MLVSRRHLTLTCGNPYIHTYIHTYIIIIIILIIIIGIYIAPFPFIKCSKALHIVIV